MVVVKKISLLDNIIFFSGFLVFGTLIIGYFLGVSYLELVPLLLWFIIMLLIIIIYLFFRECGYND